MTYQTKCTKLYRNIGQKPYDHSTLMAAIARALGKTGESEEG